jgi:hypothetical protein
MFEIPFLVEERISPRRKHSVKPLGVNNLVVSLLVVVVRLVEVCRAP